MVVDVDCLSDIPSPCKFAIPTKIKEGLTDDVNDMVCLGHHGEEEQSDDIGLLDGNASDDTTDAGEDIGDVDDSHDEEVNDKQHHHKGLLAHILMFWFLQRF